MYDVNDWRPKVQKAFLKFIIILKSSWAKRWGGIFEGGVQKTSKYFQLVTLIKQEEQ